MQDSQYEPTKIHIVNNILLHNLCGVSNRQL